jgi:hypothetical protein
MTRQAQIVRRQVWNGDRKYTSGGLTRSDLIERNGRVVSRVMSANAKRTFRERGLAADRAAPFVRGYATKKKTGSAKKKSSTKKKTGWPLFS